jgi:hypothetical protein
LHCVAEEEHARARHLPLRSGNIWMYQVVFHGSPEDESEHFDSWEPRLQLMAQPPALDS